MGAGDGNPSGEVGPRPRPGAMISPVGTGNLGRLLLGAGALLLAVGALLVLAERLPGFLRLGRLPGDLSFGKGSFRVYFPLATSLLLSVVLSLLLWVLRRR